MPALLLNASWSSRASALGFKKDLKKEQVELSEYTVGDDGLRYYDLQQGSGRPIAKGDSVKVHFDCLYSQRQSRRGSILVMSSRSARLLGGNRSIAEPFDFIAGRPVTERQAAVAGESAGGLFSGASGPTPPKALSRAVLGMKQGGKRSIIVPPELGYGPKGFREIPPGQDFELVVEVLNITKEEA